MLSASSGMINCQWWLLARTWTEVAVA